MNNQLNNVKESQQSKSTTKELKELKLQRRKSTSAIPLKISSDIKTFSHPDERKDSSSIDEQCLVSEPSSLDSNSATTSTAIPPPPPPPPPPPLPQYSSAPTKVISKNLVKERKKTWEYFEIDHPKAITDKKLQQLKAKYARRRTENNLSTTSSTVVADEAAATSPNMTIKTS